MKKSIIPNLIAGAAGAVVALLIPLVVSPTSAETKLLPFQGRLTDANGVAIADGAKVVEFKMYDAPTGGAVKWAGEVHKLSVNGGLVNTLLGSKASLGGVDFGTPTFLQMTVDANDDGQIDAADPPLLPRQSVVPTVFAMEAGNARKLAAGDGSSHDWSVLFANQNPVTGTFPVSRVAIPAGSIAPDRIAATNGLTAAHLAPNSVGLSELANDSVDSAAIVNGVVKTDDIGNATVSHAKLLGRRAGPTPNAGVGEVAVSQGSGNFTQEGEGWELVPNFTIRLQTTGRPVRILIVPDGNSGAWIDYRLKTPSLSSGNHGIFRLSRRTVDGETVVQQARLNPRIASEAAGDFGLSGFIDFPPAGTHDYQFFVGSTDGGTVRVVFCKLVAYEL